MESLKNLIWLIIGGIVLLHIAGVSQQDIEQAATDLHEMVDRELEEWRNDQGPPPTLSGPHGEGPTMVAAGRPGI